MKKRVNWRLWVGLLVSAACLAFVLRKIELRELWGHLRQASIGYILLALSCFAGALLIRAKRWQVLLSPIHTFSLSDSFSYLMIGRMVSNLLPFRAGDAVRLVLLGRKHDVSKSAILATVILEQLVDVLSLFLLLLGLPVAMDVPLAVKRSAGLFAGVAGTGFVGLWFLAGQPRAAKYLAELVSELIPPAIRDKASGLLVSFIRGLRSLRSLKQLLVVIAWSFASWALVVVTAILFQRAVGLQLPWYASLLVVIVTNLGGAIPASPGSIGVFHFLVVSALSLLGVDKEVSLTFALVYHELVLLFSTATGAFSLWREGLSFAYLRQGSLYALESETR